MSTASFPVDGHRTEWDRSSEQTVNTLFEKWREITSKLMIANQEANDETDFDPLLEERERIGRTMITAVAVDRPEAVQKLTVVDAVLEEGGAADHWERDLLRSTIRDLKR